LWINIIFYRERFWLDKSKPPALPPPQQQQQQQQPPPQQQQQQQALRPSLTISKGNHHVAPTRASNSKGDENDVHGRDFLRYTIKEQNGMLRNRLQKTEEQFKTTSEKALALEKQVEEISRQLDEEIQEKQESSQKQEQTQNSLNEAHILNKKLRQQLTRAKEEKEGLIAKYESDKFVLQQRVDGNGKYATNYRKWFIKSILRTS
jgi:hypothetical protein